MTRLNESAGGVASPGHIHAVDLVRVLTFACVIAVHTVSTVNPADSVPAGGAEMLLHFTREAFFALTAFVLMYRYHGRLPVRSFWRRRFWLIGAPYVAWTVIYSGLAQITTPLAPSEALIQLGRNLLTGAACYHLYFLIVTMQFYLLFPAFRRLLLLTRGRYHWLLAGGAVLQVAINAGLHAAHPNGLAEQLWHYDGSFVGSYVLYLLLGGVAALHADRAHGWVRAHPVTVVVVLLFTGAAAEDWYLRSVRHGVPLMAASDVFQAVMVPWCLAAITALFALGVAWADRRGIGPGSQVIKIGSDRSFGVFLVHPMLLLAWMLGPAGWLSTRIPALWSTIFAIIAVTSGSLLVVELLRRSPLSLMLTGKRRSRDNASVHSGRAEPSVLAEPIRLSAERI
ncbi:MAG TPA: acyltransferase [Pseudonocardiaceae bacterium]|nr:acyltransferase [Pseudonocardiaceae bacterium]